MKRFCKKKIAFIIMLLVLSLIILTVMIAAVRIVQYGSIDEKTHCDAAIVLGAATADGEVSPVYRERINHSIWLYQNGYVDYLIMTGGIGKGNETSDAYIAKQYAIEKDIPEQAILIEEQSTITEENLKYAKMIMDAHSMDTAIIVSDPLHMKRAMLMADDFGITAYSSPTPTTMYRSAKTQLPFLGREVFFYIGYSVVRLFR